jgi:hypothetical protein
LSQHATVKARQTQAADSSADSTLGMHQRTAKCTVCILTPTVLGLQCMSTQAHPGCSVSHPAAVLMRDPYALDMHPYHRQAPAAVGLTLLYMELMGLKAPAPVGDDDVRAFRHTVISCSAHSAGGAGREHRREWEGEEGGEVQHTEVSGKRRGRRERQQQCPTCQLAGCLAMHALQDMHS